MSDRPEWEKELERRVKEMDPGMRYGWSDNLHFPTSRILSLWDVGMDPWRALGMSFAQYPGEWKVKLFDLVGDRRDLIREFKLGSFEEMWKNGEVLLKMVR